MPSLPASDIPALTKDQMVEVDRLMVDVYGISLLQMMENAGRHLAALARARFLNGNPAGRTVVVFAGRGGNGGGALVAARNLCNWGADVTVITSRPPETFSGVPGHQLEILRRLPVTIRDAQTLSEPPAVRSADLLIDGLIGYSLAGAPRGAAADLIRLANAQTAPTLALDTPSGLNVTTGDAYAPTVRAAATMTLALPKHGLLTAAARPHVGDLYLADISVPPGLYKSLDMALPPIFARSPILHLTL